MNQPKLEKMKVTPIDKLGIETTDHSRADYFRFSIGFGGENTYHVNISVGTSAEHWPHSISWFQIRNGDKK